MNHSNRELLSISLGHVVFKAPLSNTSPDNPASPDIDNIKLSKYAPLPQGR
jgi:hypothetical protein